MPCPGNSGNCGIKQANLWQKKFQAVFLGGGGGGAQSPPNHKGKKAATLPELNHLERAARFHLPYLRGQTTISDGQTWL